MTHEHDNRETDAPRGLRRRRAQRRDALQDQRRHRSIQASLLQVSRDPQSVAEGSPVTLQGEDSFDVDGAYRVRLRQPGDTLSIVIDYETEGTKALTATLRGERSPFTGRDLFCPAAIFRRVQAGFHTTSPQIHGA